MECKLKNRDLLLIRYADTTIVSGGIIHPPSVEANYMFKVWGIS